MTALFKKIQIITRLIINADINCIIHIGGGSYLTRTIFLTSFNFPDCIKYRYTPAAKVFASH